MSKKLLLSGLGLLLVSAPFASVQAENINIYGWQNWSYEWVDADKGRDYDRLSNNAANIGFMSHMDTGIPDLQVGLRCEQFTYWGRLNNYTGWCNRNSKISLRHETMGEIMFGQWLLPYNEIVAQWVDPFYDAGADSHTSIMGNLGLGGLESLFYNGSFSKGTDFTARYGALAFNRRQEGVIQYVWPNTSAMASQSRDGFQFRLAVTEGSGTDSGGLDPRIWSTGVAYQYNMGNGGQVWAAAAYERHDDTYAAALATTKNPISCRESEDDGYRLAARYAHDWGTGMKTQIAVMYEELDYDFDDCSGVGDGLGIGHVGANIRRDVDVDRDAWMISGKHSFGNGLDFRFSFMDAHDLDLDCSARMAGERCISVNDNDTEAEAYNIGLFYTMPAGTELRATYSEIDNDDNANYDFGINGGGSVRGEDIDMFAIGIVHWFD